MSRILVLGAGGPAAIGFVRALGSGRFNRGGPAYTIIGADSDVYNLQRSASGFRYKLPRVDDANYLKRLNDLIELESIDFVHAQSDVEVAFLSKHEFTVNAKLFLPDDDVVENCQDKFASYLHWVEAGLKVPETEALTWGDYRLGDFLDRHVSVWVRKTKGAGGTGSFVAYNEDDIIAGLRSFGVSPFDPLDGWTISQRLTDNSVTWQALYFEGNLIAGQGRKRHRWEMGKLSLSGVSGATGVGEMVSDPVVDDIAQKAILAIDPEPHGLYGVDMTYDHDGVPNPTEINIGRFFTTMAEFMAQTGYNMAEEYVQLGLTGKIEGFIKGVNKPSFNPCREGALWIRGMDVPPVCLLGGKDDLVNNWEDAA